ncbi:MAG TPA: alpha/beta fold hydrolase [Vicinamibacterales bacterium]|nr:alpha/beta fold hydrolase [Vicinamibacterales bacterium]
MPEESVREISGPAGPLEIVLDLPDGVAKAAAVFAHPHPLHGGTMHTKAVYQSAKALARAGAAVLRFNFRGVGRSFGVHDGGPGEMADFAAALDYLSGRFPGLPLWAAGFSFGSYIAMNAGAADARVQALIGVGTAIDRYDYTAVKSSDKHKFVVHGEFDELISVKDVKKFYAQLAEPKDLVVIDAADHLFTGKTLELSAAVEDLLKDFSYG